MKEKLNVKIKILLCAGISVLLISSCGVKDIREISVTAETAVAQETLVSTETAVEGETQEPMETTAAGEMSGSSEATVAGEMSGSSEATAAGEMTGSLETTVAGEISGSSEATATGEMFGPEEITAEREIPGLSETAVATEASVSSETTALRETTLSAGTPLPSETPILTATPAPTAEPIPIPATVKVSIYGADSFILEETEVEWVHGQTVFDVLKQVTHGNKIHMDFNGRSATAYVIGINNLYEFDRGPESGWVYYINGAYAGRSAGAYSLEEGDVIQWRYTTKLSGLPR